MKNHKNTYYVIGRWEIYENFPYYATKNGEPQIYSFENIQDAIDFIKTKIIENVNISWAISRSFPKVKANPNPSEK